MESIATLVLSIPIINPSHVHRKSNKLIDHLANEGVNKTLNPLDLTWNQLPNNPFKLECNNISHKDMSFSKRMLEREGMVE